MEKNIIDDENIQQNEKERIAELYAIELEEEEEGRLFLLGALIPSKIQNFVFDTSDDEYYHNLNVEESNYERIRLKRVRREEEDEKERRYLQHQQEQEQKQKQEQEQKQEGKRKRRRF